MEKYLKFRLENQSILLSLEQIIIVVYLAELQQVPANDPSFDGFLNYHGKPIAIFNLAKLLNTPTVSSYTLDTPIILCQAGNKLVGLTVSEVDEVVEIPAAQIQATELSERIPYIDGLYEHSDSESWLINISKLITHHKLTLEGFSDHQQ